MRKRFHFFITLPIIMMFAGTLFFLFLPYLLDHYLFPRLIADLPFATKQLSLSRLSPWKIRGTLTMADQDWPTLAVPRFEISYTPSSLLKRKIAVLLFDSASLQIDMRNGQPILRGLPTRDSSRAQEENTPAFILPLAVETIILQNCSITIHRDSLQPILGIIDGSFTLGFLEQPGGRKLLSTLSGQILTKGDLSLSGRLDLQSVDKGYVAELHLQAPDIGQLISLAPGLKELQITGGLFLSGQVSFDRSSNHITGYEATVKSPDLQIRKNNIVLASKAAESPVSLQFSGDMEKVQYSATNIYLAEPEQATIDLAGEMALLDGTFSGSGHMFLARINSAVAVDINGNTQQAQTTLSYKLASDAFTLGEASVNSFTADGNINLNGATITATLNGIIPEITLKKNKIKLTNLALQLPFQYPPPLVSGPPGGIKIDRIHYQNINSGRLQATVRQSPQGAAFTTFFTTPFVPALQLSCDGSATPTADISVHCHFPKTPFNSSTFPRFLDLPKELALYGNLAAAGEFHLTDKGPAGKLNIDIHDTTLTHGENKLSNINMGIVFPRLPLLQSDPGQLCTIGALDFDKIKLSDARIHFRIEDEQSIFLEKMRANWCGGKVETGGFTLAANMKNLETTLYCDRLGFTELLAQFGIDKAEGQGSLNGRLPMVISKQGVIFDDGFLFSTPGNSGIVRFNDTKQLRQGIPDESRSAYLDYSMKALENFEYNWTKLSFNSQKDELLISMQLDGKPAEPLPFGYQNGQIVTSRQGPGLQHPIRLDVNFRLPMQDLFQYGKNIQSMMEKM
jgi:hypothetical protein